jgi:multiple RNA-binding domain-containing protein 1
MPENAVSAYTELNGSNFHGRMFHLMPGKSDDKNNKDDEIEESNFKKKKQAELKKSAQSAHNWNTLFLGPDAVAEVMSKSYGKSKEEILDTSSGGTSAAVRIALGETQIVLEMKKFLEKHGVRLEVFDDVKAKRSKTIIIAKNLPPNTTENEMREKFSPFGALEKVVLPPSGVTCLIKFESGTEARKAFVKLAYTKFKKLPLFLEWAPENTFKNKSEIITEDEEKVEEKKIIEEIDEIPPQPNTTLFIKNLSLETTEDSIREHFKHIGQIHTIQIATKKNSENPQKPIPLGYGFIQFKLSSSTDKALRNLQFSILDNQKIELKRSDRTLHGQENDRITSTSVVKKKEGSAKILVKNVPFQADGNELREIFKVFGDIKAVRLPRKIGAGSEQHRGFGFIDFVAKSDAKQAFEALRHSTHLYGRRLILEWADNDEDVTEIRKRTAQQAGAFSNGPPKKKSVIEGDDYVKAKSDDEDEF